MEPSISKVLGVFKKLLFLILKLAAKFLLTGFKFLIWAISNPKRFINFLFRIDKRDLLTALTAFVILITFIPVFTYLYFARDLKTVEGIMNKNDTGLVLLDRKERPFFTFYEAKNRTYIPLSDIPKPMQQAMIAAEDHEFYSHPGFSIKGIAGAIVADFRTKQLAFGGSTITQQLVKNSLLTSQKSFLRKYQELILSQEVERRYGKDKILEMYLNSVYFGEGAFGVQEAAEAYFGKDAKNLNLAESSLLAGLVQSPSRYSPLSGDLDLAKKRQNFVLSQMVEQKYITSVQKQEVLEQDLSFKSTPSSINSTATHFALMVKQELIDKYGEEKIARSGFKVVTSIDLDFQKFAEKTVETQVKNLEKNKVSNGAAVVLDPTTGEVKALVGSRDWFNNDFGKVNIAMAQRQPGSAFKPIVYTAAFEKNIITPGTILRDQPVTYKIPGSPDYKPQNYDLKFRGPVLPRRALSNSLNIPAVEVMNKVGVPSVLAFAHRLGITTLNDESRYGISLVLGAGEVKLLDLTTAYAVFANHGIKNNPTLITKIENKRQQVIYKYEPKGEKVLDPEYAFQISQMLADNKARQEVFGSALTISRPAAVKTGTTNDYKDAWTMGYTPSLAIGVWVGNNNNQAMDKVAGSLGAAPIWKALMEQFLKGTPVENFEKPSNIIEKTICQSNGLLVRNATSSAQIEYFVKGTEPIRYCNGDGGPKPPSFVAPGTNDQNNNPSQGQGKKQSQEENQGEKQRLNNQYQEGGWYPIGPGGKALQYWKGGWYATPQQ